MLQSPRAEGLGFVLLIMNSPAFPCPLGSKHKTMVEARNGAGPIKSYPRPGSRMKVQNGTKGSGLQNKTFHCEICDVHVNSEIQLKQVTCMYLEVFVGLSCITVL